MNVLPMNDMRGAVCLTSHGHQLMFTILMYAAFVFMTLVLGIYWNVLSLRMAHPVSSIGTCTANVAVLSVSVPR
jgi:Kef-type K+ transport system membrane component KefB